uniref:AAA+ ATPase domain-containing protein n=1 Tax=Globodera rostochiensis TaxID=31243 RepID=A0A914HZJ2_GLORO
MLRFCDLGGCESQFLEAIQLLTHLKHPELCAQIGFTPPKGLLLHGPPGCGKSAFAMALAGELRLPILSVSSTELVAGISGESERKIRTLFSEAKIAAPALLLIDDIDVIAAKRENAQREMERRIVTQLIASIDELSSCENGRAEDGGHVLVIGTTNRLEVLDASLRRAGRFDREIALGMPGQRARIEILKIVTRQMQLDVDVDLAVLARLTPGYVGADLLALVQESNSKAISRALGSVVDANLKNEKMESLCCKNIDDIREELTRTVNWLNSPTTEQQKRLKIEQLRVRMSDFEWALRVVRPSAKREGFATVPDVRWDDIGALGSVREELKWSILYPIQKPEFFELFGTSARPQGILLCGPPGCGKTLLAKAVANETGMSFISVKGPELLSMYVGESERAVRTVFQRARDSAPCVVFFDEIDALCPKRTQKEHSGSSRLVNQLLTEMDGLEERKNVFLIGATNRPDIVDPAVTRPGRFDKILFVDFPSSSEKADILRKSTRNGTHPRIDSSVCFDTIASNSALEFFTGADLVALIHEATLCALRQRIEQNDPHIDSVQLHHFEEAFRRIRPSVRPMDREHYSKLREKYTAKTAPEAND